MSQPFTTRAQAAVTSKMSPAKIEAIAEWTYESGKSATSSLPLWKDVNASYQDAIRREVNATLKHAENMGWIIVVTDTEA